VNFGTRRLKPKAKATRLGFSRFKARLCNTCIRLPFSRHRHLSVDHTTAARYLFLLAHDGIVEPVEKADRARRRATRYRYRTD
jgi:hypothetical protein